jgi:hypothetical protein
MCYATAPTTCFPFRCELRASVKASLFLLLWHIVLPVGTKAQDYSEALDIPGQAFTVPQGAWSLGQEQDARDGVDCLRNSGPAEQAAELRTVFTGPGWLVFWHASSGFYNSSLTVDGITVRTLSLNSGQWQQEVVEFGTGSHEIGWQVPGNTFLRLDAVSLRADLAVPVSDALPGLTWTTGGETPWTAVLAPSGTLTGRAQVRLPYSSMLARAGWLETVITGPCELRWSQLATGGGAVETLVDGVSQMRGSFASGECSGVLPPGPHTVRWRMQRAAATGSSEWTGAMENLRVNAAELRPLAEVLDTPGMEWSTGGDAPWSGTVTSGGVPPLHGAYSGLIQKGQQSWLETVVTGPGILRTQGYAPPAWKNQLRLTVNDRTLLAAFDNANVAVGTGTQRVRWTLAPAAAANTANTFAQAWINAVEWMPATTVPLEDALESAGLTFAVSAPEDVVALPNANGGTDDGVFVRAGAALSATVSGPAELTWTKSPGGFDCRLDGLLLNAGTAESGRLEIPPGPHVVSWTAKTGPVCWFYSLTSTPQPLLPATVPGSGGLVWETSPEVSFFHSSAGDMACFFMQAAPTQAGLYGLRTTVTGPGILTLRCGQRSTGFARLLLDAAPFQLTAPFWMPYEFHVPPGVHTLTVTAPAPTLAGTVLSPVFLQLYEASWQSQETVSLAEAVDAPALTFTTGGANGGWQGVSSGGSDFAWAANLPSSQSAWMETSVTGPGLLTFRLSIRGNVYAPQFSLNGTARTVSLIDQNAFSIPPGTHALRWSVTQPTLGGPSPQAGQCAVLDDVSWIPFAPQPLATWSGGAGLTFTASGNDWSAVNGPDRSGVGSIHPLNVTAEPAWLETTVTGPAALSFATYVADYDYSSRVTVTLDGGVRSLLAAVPDGVLRYTGWTEQTLYIPAGDHTVRWTLPWNGPLVWLDDFKLRPAGADFAGAAEWDETSWEFSSQRLWFSLTDPELPDGDAVAVESGFLRSGIEEDQLCVSFSGPGRLSLLARSELRPNLVVDDYLPVLPAAWSAGPDGWMRVTLTLPDGFHALTVTPQGDGPLLMDSAAWEPLPGLRLDQIFPLDGATWSTGGVNPFVALSDPGLTPQPSAFCRVGPGPSGGWLQSTVTGPGTLSFQTAAFGNHYDASFEVAVNNHPLARVTGVNESGGDLLANQSAGLPDAPRSWSLVLPPGSHTVRWTIPELLRNHDALFRLQALSFSPDSLFSGISGDGAEVFLYNTAAAPQRLNDTDGAPFVRLYPGEPNTDLINGYNEYRNVLSTRVSAPGFFKFLYRSSSGAWPEGAQAWYSLWHQPLEEGDYPTAGGNAFTPSSAWREGEFFVSDRPIHLQWVLTTLVPGLDIKDLQFVPVASIPLDEALDLPRTVTATDPARPWRGWRATDGAAFTTPAAGYNFGGSYTWMEATLTGPAAVSWNERYLPGNWWHGPDIDGLYGFAEQVSHAETRDQSRLELTIPAGTHKVRWWLPLLHPGTRTGVSGVRIKPLPPAYADWQPMGRNPPPSTDSDGDGVLNLEEFLWSTDPYTPSLPPQPVISIAGGHLHISLPAPVPEMTGVRLFFESSSDLGVWQRASVESVPASAGRVQYRVPKSANRIFLRPRTEFAK